METMTDLTCPECGEQQSNAEECTSCGASLLSPAEDIQGIKGEKTVSSPWPTTTPSQTDAPEEPSGPEAVQHESAEEDVASPTADSQSDTETLEEPTETNPPTTTNEWKPTTIDSEEEPITAHSEPPPSQEDVLLEETRPESVSCKLSHRHRLKTHLKRRTPISKRKMNHLSSQHSRSKKPQAPQIELDTHCFGEMGKRSSASLSSIPF